VPGLVTLLTDFGTADGYVGEVKGELLSRVPDATVVDIAHDIAPQDVDGARLALARYWRRYPAGTVHVVVVDPGVGTARLPIAVASGDRFFVGPDNGVLSPALFSLDAHAVALPVPERASQTFHGRDVFAPAAADLLRGAALAALGRPVAEPVRRRTPEPRRLADGSLAGEVITVDRFGNAITNLFVRGQGIVEAAGRKLPVVATYADVACGELAALVGSNGFLEIARRDGSAAEALGLGRGTVVRWRQLAEAATD
jgi:S-adenosylmethionine hydrolase